MSITLKLDRAALEALFPEGSKARIELVNAAKAEFLRGTVKAAWVAVEQDTKQFLEESYKNEFRKELEALTRWSPKKGRTLSSEVESLIQREVAANIAVGVGDTVREAVAKAVAHLLPTLDKRVHDSIDLQIRQHVADQVRQRLEAALKG
jgi:hypothetical protein